MGHISNLIDHQGKQVVVNNEANKLNNTITKKPNIITQAKSLIKSPPKNSIKELSYEPIISAFLHHPSMPQEPYIATQAEKSLEESSYESSYIVTQAKKPLKELSCEPNKCNKEAIISKIPSMPKVISYEKHLACGKPIMKGSISKIKARKVYPLVRVIQMSPPTLVTTKPEDFMSVVQKLTGSPSSSSKHVPPLEDIPLSNPLDFDANEPNLQRRMLAEEHDMEGLAFDDECMHDPTLLQRGSSSHGHDHVHDCSTINHDRSVLDHVCISNTSDDNAPSDSRFSIDACFDGLDDRCGADLFEAQSISNQVCYDECAITNYSPLQWDLLDEIDDDAQALQLPQISTTSALQLPQIGAASVPVQLLNGCSLSAWDAQYHLIAS